MAKLPMTHNAHVVFCDDIRFEQYDKISLVGVYDSALIVPSYPYLLPRLAVCVWMYAPAAEPFNTVELTLSIDEHVLSQGNFSIPQEGGSYLDSFSHLPARDPEEETIQRFRTQTILPPISIEADGTLVLKIKTDRGDLKTSPLLIRTEESLAQSVKPRES